MLPEFICLTAFGDWTMKETATAVGATISGAYSAFLGGMAIKLIIEGIRRSFATPNTSPPDLEASNSEPYLFQNSKLY